MDGRRYPAWSKLLNANFGGVGSEPVTVTVLNRANSDPYVGGATNDRMITLFMGSATSDAPPNIRLCWASMSTFTSTSSLEFGDLVYAVPRLN